MKAELGGEANNDRGRTLGNGVFVKKSSARI